MDHSWVKGLDLWDLPERAARWTWPTFWRESPISDPEVRKNQSGQVKVGTARPDERDLESGATRPTVAFWGLR